MTGREDIPALLDQASTVLLRVREGELRKVGLTAMQASVLQAIHANGGEATPAEISRRVVREPHTISGLVNRMAIRGLIHQTKDLPRKNQVRVTATKAGKYAYAQSLKESAFHNVVAALTDDECFRLSANLQCLRDRGLDKLQEQRRKA